MALLDKVKSQATQAVHKAQEAGRSGQARLEEVQARRKVDRLLQALGAVTYAQRSGQPAPEGPSADELVAQIDELKATHGDAVVANAPEESGEG